MESPYGPTLRQNDGGVYRFEPRTAKIETYVPMNFPEPARPRLRPLGPGHHLRRHRRPAVLRPVVHDEEVLPRDGDQQGAAAGQRAHAAGGRHGHPLEPAFPGGHAGQRHRAQHDRLPRPAQLQAERGRRRAEVGRGRAADVVGRRELPAGRRGGRARRRAVLRRLAQPHRRPHAAQPARQHPRPGARPHLPRHGRRQAAAHAEADRRPADSGAPRPAEGA